MKKRIIVIIVLIINMSSCSFNKYAEIKNKEAEEYFEEGLVLLENKEEEKAKEKLEYAGQIYEALGNMGTLDGGNNYYNAGNAYRWIGRKQKAAEMYYKAILKNFGNKEARINLIGLQQGIKEKDINPLLYYSGSIYLVLLIIIGIMSLALMFMVMKAVIQGDGLRKKSIYIISIIILAILQSYYIIKIQINKLEYGIVKTPEYMYMGESILYPKVYEEELGEGIFYFIIEEKENYKKVKLLSDQEGWIKK